MGIRACVLSILALYGTASAAVIPVVNASFEEPAYGDGGYGGSGTTGWQAVGPIGAWGAFHPTIGTWGYAASHLNQLLYINGGTVEQILSDTVQVGETYSLMVDIVRRPNFGTDVYSIELLAGTTVIASDSSTLQPAPGQFATKTLSYTSFAGDGVAGLPLTIRLGGGNQVNFDNVRLMTVPATGSLAIVGVGGLFAGRRRRR